jgi:hypothetical protein
MNTIPSALIAGMLPCAGKNDIRHYINGVFIEPRNGKAIAVSTDGNMLCVAHTALYWNLDAIIIPRDVCEQLAKMKGDIVFSSVGEGRHFKATCGSSTIGFTAIDGNFPKWRDVVPALLNQAPAAFALGLLDQVIKSAKAFAKGFGCKKSSGVVLRPVGEAAMLAGLTGINEGEAIERVDYVVMPLRGTYPGVIDPEAARA